MMEAVTVLGGRPKACAHAAYSLPGKWSQCTYRPPVTSSRYIYMSGPYGSVRCLRCMWLQRSSSLTTSVNHSSSPSVHTVTASITYGYSLYCIRLQPDHQREPPPLANRRVGGVGDL